MRIHDPKVEISQISKDLNLPPSNSINRDKNTTKEGEWYSFKNLENIFKNADAALVLTEWNDYTKINWFNASKEMRSPAWVFDARSILDPQEVINAGLNFWRVGDGLDRNIK